MVWTNFLLNQLDRTSLEGIVLGRGLKGCPSKKDEMASFILLDGVEIRGEHEFEAFKLAYRKGYRTDPPDEVLIRSRDTVDDIPVQTVSSSSKNIKKSGEPEDPEEEVVADSVVQDGSLMKERDSKDADPKKAADNMGSDNGMQNQIDVIKANMMAMVSSNEDLKNMMMTMMKSMTSSMDTMRGQVDTIEQKMASTSMGSNGYQNDKNVTMRRNLETPMHGLPCRTAPMQVAAMSNEEKSLADCNCLSLGNDDCEQPSGSLVVADPCDYQMSEIIAKFPCLRWVFTVMNTNRPQAVSSEKKPNADEIKKLWQECVIYCNKNLDGVSVTDHYSLLNEWEGFTDLIKGYFKFDGNDVSVGDLNDVLWERETVLPSVVRQLRKNGLNGGYANNKFSVEVYGPIIEPSIVMCTVALIMRYGVTPYEAMKLIREATEFVANGQCMCCPPYMQADGKGHQWVSSWVGNFKDEHCGSDTHKEQCTKIMSYTYRGCFYGVLQAMVEGSRLAYKVTFSDYNEASWVRDRYHEGAYILIKGQYKIWCVGIKCLLCPEKKPYLECKIDEHAKGGWRAKKQYQHYNYFDQLVGEFPGDRGCEQLYLEYRPSLLCNEYALQDVRWVRTMGNETKNVLATIKPKVWNKLVAMVGDSYYDASLPDEWVYTVPLTVSDYACCKDVKINGKPYKSFAGGSMSGSYYNDKKEWYESGPASKAESSTSPIIAVGGPSSKAESSTSPIYNVGGYTPQEPKGDEWSPTKVKLLRTEIDELRDMIKDVKTLEAEINTLKVDNSLLQKKLQQSEEREEEYRKLLYGDFNKTL